MSWKMTKLHLASKTALTIYDATACYDSFKKHWQQIEDIVDSHVNEINVSGQETKHDDVLTVVNHLSQISSLIQLDLRINNISPSCVPYLLGKNLLDKLCLWTISASRYNNSLKIEQLKIYELLLQSSFQEDSFTDTSFFAPLVKLLASFDGDCLPVDIEKRLLVFLNQLCSSFSLHRGLLEFFFPSRRPRNDRLEFDIFSLLVQFVHRDGVIGEQARNSLLLCVGLSKSNEEVASHIITNICPILAAGLGGLYSLLPRRLPQVTAMAEWHRFGADQVFEMPELNNFLHSLEFCNAASQVCHPNVKMCLLDLVYQGFLAPIVAPALLQSTEEELIATTGYFELWLRSVTHPGLLHAFVKFVLKERYDGRNVIDTLVKRITYDTKLCVMTLSLLETLVDLNCEDLMLELVLKYLIPCTHVMFSQKSRIRRYDPYCASADKFLSLAVNLPWYDNSLLEEEFFSDYYIYLRQARNRIQSCSKATANWTYPYDGDMPPQNGFSTKQEEFLKRTLDFDLEPTSLPSADDGSSGYESYKLDKNTSQDDDNEDKCESNPPSPSASEITLDSSPDFSPSKTHFFLCSPKKSTTNSFNTTPTIGPFLTAIFDKLENSLNGDLHVLLRLTGLITRLAIYPQPLMYSYLLDHSLVFQPCIKSLFQVLTLLKHKIESRLSKHKDVRKAYRDARLYLQERQQNNNLNTNNNNNNNGNKMNKEFRKGKRKSLSDKIGSMFKRNGERVEAVENGYRYIKSDDREATFAALCSVVMNEWLKELAAITQEHSILRQRQF